MTGALSRLLERLRPEEPVPPRPPSEPREVVLQVLDGLDDHDLLDACRRSGAPVRERLTRALPGTPPVIAVCEAAREAARRDLIDDREMREVWAMAPLLLPAAA